MNRLSVPSSEFAVTIVPDQTHATYTATANNAPEPVGADDYVTSMFLLGLGGAFVSGLIFGPGIVLCGLGAIIGAVAGLLLAE